MKKNIFLFLIIPIMFFSIAYNVQADNGTCTDGIQNQNETAIDIGGICTPLDGSYIGPNFQEWLFVNGIIIFLLAFQTWGIIYRPSTKLIR